MHSPKSEQIDEFSQVHVFHASWMNPLPTKNRWIIFRKVDLPKSLRNIYTYIFLSPHIWVPWTLFFQVNMDVLGEPETPEEAIFFSVGVTLVGFEPSEMVGLG